MNADEATLGITIPSTLEAAARDLASKRGVLIDDLVASALHEYLHFSPSRIYQISTSVALVEGINSGSISSSTLLEHGDFGLGTFDGLDGEMVILDGGIYQASGSARRRSDEFPVPFASVTQYCEEAVFQINQIASLADVEVACDRYRPSDNLFYALRLDGVFGNIHARAVHPAQGGAKLLDAAQSQLEFHYQNVEGTLVCLWSPRYSSSFSIPGYHFHFLSKDRTKGGHVLNCTAGQLRVGVQTISEYDVRLPEKGTFLKADFSKDPASVLAKAE